MFYGTGVKIVNMVFRNGFKVLFIYSFIENPRISCDKCIINCDIFMTYLEFSLCIAANLNNQFIYIREKP